MILTAHLSFKSLLKRTFNFRNHIISIKEDGHLALDPTMV